MIVHVVKPGESLYSISRLYNVSFNKIDADNELDDPSRLVVGQTVVILEGMRRPAVTLGQTFYSIPVAYVITISELATANSQITNPSLIYPGQVLNIPSSTRKLGTIEVNGYAFTNINMEVLRKTLPNLTDLSIFSHEVKEDGTLRYINDAVLIEAARQAKVAPLLVITNLLPGGGFSSDLAHTILSSEQLQDILLNNVLETLRTKKYYGLDIDFEYIYPDDRQLYNSFLRNAVEKLRPLVFSVTTALAPKVSADQKGLLYEAHGYPVHGQLVSHVILVTYEWGAEIQYDTVYQAPFFNYYDSNAKQHVVWFEDARSIRAKLQLVNELRLSGIRYWTIGRYFPQNWLVLNSLYNIKKVIS